MDQGLEREWGRENIWSPLAETLKPRGFREQFAGERIATFDSPSSRSGATESLHDIIKKMRRGIIFILIGILILLVGWLAFHTEESAIEEQPKPFTSEKVDVYAPLPNSIVESPLEITGEARGWYFEGSFPVKITDANGNILGQAPAEAQGDWMTTSSVPFKATIGFSTSTTKNGYLILEKDNPSGMPEKAESVEIPVKFR